MAKKSAIKKQIKCQLSHAELEAQIVKWAPFVKGVWQGIAHDLPPGESDLGDMADALSCSCGKFIDDMGTHRFEILTAIVKRYRLNYI